MTDTAEAAPEGERNVSENDVQSRSRRRRRVVTQWLIVLCCAVLLAFGIRSVALQAFFVPSSSMVPTLEVGDRILIQKAFLNWHDLRDGEIIVFTHPPADTECVTPGVNVLVKRVIALPGQRVYSIGNSVYVDGHRLSEPYVTQPLGRAVATKQDPFRVPAGELYVMGDNRSISCDSRVWGPIKGTSVIGKVIVLWWHNGHPNLQFF